MKTDPQSGIPLNILIVEDEAIIAEDLKESLQGLGYNVAGVAASYDEAMELLKREKPDFVMLDIILDGPKDGIALAADIREEYGIPFIFLTSHADRATVERAKAVKPSGYLLKPFEEDDLYSAIEIGVANFSAKKVAQPDDKPPENNNGFVIKDSVFVKDKRVYIKLPVDDILYLKSDGNYMHIQGDHFHHLVRSTQNEMLNILPADSFMKVHRSYIVNLHNIKAIHPNVIEIGQEQVPLQKDLREELLSRLTIME